MVNYCTLQYNKKMSRVKNRLTLSLSSWFCIPDQGMKDFDILCRASAFIVKARPNKTFKHKYHIVTTSHVVAPWKWPKYYPQEWLTFVNEKHTMYTLELRQDKGLFETQSELFPISFHHETKDLAVLTLIDEERIMSRLDKLGVKVFDLDNNKFTLDSGAALEFHGHDVVGGSKNDNFDSRVPVPTVISGAFSHKTSRQTFASSARTLMDGMCGGPVVKRDGGIQLCGMVEGIVPLDHPEENLRGLAAFADVNIIDTFLTDVESGEIKPLVGGDSINDVAGDKDPSKMSIEDIIRNS